LTVAAAVVHDSWPEADHPVALALLAAALPGLWTGAEVLQVVDPSYVQLGMGVLVVVAALLLGREVRLPGAKTRWGPVLVGSVSGALASSIGLSAPRGAHPPRACGRWRAGTPSAVPHGNHPRWQGVRD
jgi:uncharacterized membrane protein YfcA